MRQADLFGGEPAAVRIAGVDEAGRGPLAGPVYAAAVILPETGVPAGLADSKKLTAQQRERLAGQIRQHALAWCIACASVEEIDTLNILQATMLAMRRACEGLSIRPELILVDGNRVPQGLPAPAQAIIKGDAKVAAISAASILAKTARDADCDRLHGLYPQYEFNRHKGYGTAIHLQRLRQFGPSPAHRLSFGPVREARAQSLSSGQVADVTPEHGHVVPDEAANEPGQRMP